MRLLYVASGFGRVGDYFRWSGFAESLASRNHEVAVVVFDDDVVRLLPRWETAGRVRIMHPPYLGGRSVAERLSSFLPESKLPCDITFRVLYTQLTRRRYDIVHFFRNGWNTFLPLKLLSLRRERSVVVDDWADLWTDGVLQRPLGGGWRRLDFRATGGLEERSCRAADGVTVNSSYLADRAAGLGVPRDRILLVREGAFTDRIRPRPKEEARRILEVDRQAFVLGFAGYFHPDTEVLLDVLDTLVRRGWHDVQLLLIGGITDRVRAHIAVSQVADRVLCTGPVGHADLDLYLAACDVLLLPFRKTRVNAARWPVKLCDYLSAGRPVVAGDWGEVGKFLREVPGAALLAPADAEGFADAVERLRRHPAVARGLASGSRRAAQTHLRWDDAASEMEAFYRRLAKEPGRL